MVQHSLPRQLSRITMRRKPTELAIIDFYNQRTVDVSEYVEAAWRFRYLEQDKDISLESYSKLKGLSPKYLGLVGQTLSTASAGQGFMKQLGAYWDALPVPVTPEGRPPEFNELMSFIEFGRKTLTPPLKDSSNPMLVTGRFTGWTFVRRRQLCVTNLPWNNWKVMC